VIDTNIVIAAVRSPGSSSRRLLDAIAAGTATLLVSPPVFREYRHILPKAVQSHEREQIIRQWLSLAEPVEAEGGPRVVPDDPDDDKFVALALQGQADAIVSNDEHLLGLNEKIDVPVLRPGEAVERLKA
jgi:putative PIN family toxin of toxin-antitoxin system